MLRAPGSNLQAVAVSSRDGGPITDATEFTLTGYVRKKLTASEMHASGILPFRDVLAQTDCRARLPKSDLDIVESGSDFRPLANLSTPTAQQGVYGGPPPLLDSQKYFHSLRAGIGTTNAFDYPNTLSVGSIGFFVRARNATQDVAYLVTNNHVIGRSCDETQLEAVLGNPVVQPGTLDLTAVELLAFPTLPALEQILKIGEVAAVVPLQFVPLGAGTPPVNLVDAAIASLLLPKHRSSEDLDRVTHGGGIRGTASFKPDRATGRVKGDGRVFKVGRTTGYTEGVVTAIGGTALVPYGPGRDAYFANQIVVQATKDNVGPFSKRGDSGSGVLNARSELVGLLFAGSLLQTLVNPARDVLAALSAALGVAGLDVITV